MNTASTPLTPEALRHLARLAGLQLDDATLAALATDLAGILDHAASLAALPLDDVEPLYGLAPPDGPALPPRPGLGLTRQQLLAGAPDSAEGCVRVPRVLDRDAEGVS